MVEEESDEQEGVHRGEDLHMMHGEQEEEDSDVDMRHVG